MKTRINTILLILLAASTSLPLFAQDEPGKIVEAFFQKYKSDQGAAIDYLYANNEWMQRAGDDIDNLKVQLQNATALLGKYCGYEQIDKRKMGESFVLYSFLVKYQRQPLRFVFEFYKPEDAWKTYGFSYDKDPDTDLENTSREAVGK